MQFNSLRTGFFLYLLFIVACFKTEASTTESFESLFEHQIHQGTSHEEHLMFVAEEVNSSEDRDDDDQRKRSSSEKESARIHEVLDCLCRVAGLHAAHVSTHPVYQGAIPLRIRFGVFRI